MSRNGAARLTTASAAADPPEGDVVHHVEVGEEQVVLEDHSGAALFGRHEDPPRRIVEGAIPQTDVPGI